MYFLHNTLLLTFNLREKKKREASERFVLFETEHSFRVTSFTLGFRIFFNLLQINNNSERRCLPRLARSRASGVTMDLDIRLTILSTCATQCM